MTSRELSFLRFETVFSGNHSFWSRLWFFVFLRVRVLRVFFGIAIVFYVCCLAFRVLTALLFLRVIIVTHCVGLGTWVDHPQS